MESSTSEAGQLDEDAPTGTAVDPAAVIASGRERIDGLDRAIIELIQRRVAVSREIQQARIGSGGRRIELSREMDVLARYREALGKPGATVAMTLLELCRGQA